MLKLFEEDGFNKDNIPKQIKERLIYLQDIQRYRIVNENISKTKQLKYADTCNLIKQ